jgi:energy-coupling factor transport system permease protein
LLLGLVVGVAGYVVAARRSDVPWARSYGLFIRVGVVVLVLRVTIQMLFGPRVPGHVLFTLPSAELPDWAAGVAVGGPVSLEALLGAAYEALRLLALLACFGAANSLASPYRLLRLLPRAVYEAGVAVTVAMAFAPQAVVSLQRVRDARRLRGRPGGIRGLRGLAVPVLEGALERSVQLAASMDARGYGRRIDPAAGSRRLRTASTAVGLLAATAGVYGLLDDGSRRALGLPALAVGSALLAGSLVVGGSRAARTRYRPDPWRHAEWLTAVGGLVAAVGLVAADLAGVGALHPSTRPLAAPVLPLLPTLAVLVALAPAFLTPRPPGRTGAAA